MIGNQKRVIAGSALLIVGGGILTLAILKTEKKPPRELPALAAPSTLASPNDEPPIRRGADGRIEFIRPQEASGKELPRVKYRIAQ